MTIQVTLNNGMDNLVYMYIDVKPTQLTERREGFYAQRGWAKSGVMVQFKGKERIELARF